MSNVSSMGNSVSYIPNQKVNQTSNIDSKKTNSYGRTIGNPQISEKAAKYYEELKDKYSNMDFILVSADQKEQAQSQAASYANANKMVVLIDEDKIERMAEDENYRKQIEDKISNAVNGMQQFSEKLGTVGTNIKGFGMQINDDGTTKFFAVLEKSSAAQKERIEKHAEAKRTEKKNAEKKAKKAEQQERLEEHRKSKKAEDDTVTISANSIEELMSKIEEYGFQIKSDSIQTEKEKMVGQNIDFNV